MKDFTIQKGHFRNNPRFGRTTRLLFEGKVVEEFMGSIGLRAAVKEYQRPVNRCGLRTGPRAERLQCSTE